MIQLAFYKGPAEGLAHQLAHEAVAWWTHGPYSHVELVTAEGVCWSSSARDGGVRCKRIDLHSGRWDLLAIEADEAAALNWFEQHAGEGYDWLGLAGFLVPWRIEARARRFCSEAVASALGLPGAWHIDPNELHRIVICARQLGAPIPVLAEVS